MIVDTSLSCAGFGACFGIAMLPKWRRHIVPFGYSDTLVQLIVLDHPENFEGSLMLPYARSTAACADWPWLALRRVLRLHPVHVDAIRYVLTLSAAAAAVGVTASALGASLPLALLAAALLLGSRFTEVGWWFRPAYAFFTTHGTLALAWGASLLGLALLHGHAGVVLAALAGLLTSYHPVHGLIVSGILVLFGLAGLLHLNGAGEVLPLALAWICGLLPLVIQLVRQRLTCGAAAVTPARDPARWWQLMRARTRNIFALAGLDARSGGGGLRTLSSPPVLVAAVAALSMGALAASPDTTSHAFFGVTLIAAAGAAGFFAQWIVSDGLRIPVLARLALARATTYMTPVACIAWAVLAAAAISHSATGAATALLCLLAVTWVPRADNSWTIALSMLTLAAASGVGMPWSLAAGFPFLALATAVILPWVAQRVASPSAARHLAGARDHLLAAFRLGRQDWLPLLLLAAAALLLAQPLRPALPRALAPHAMPAFAAFAILLALRFALACRSPLHIPAAAWESLQHWARAHTPTGAMFLIPPYLSGFEVFSQRPKLIDGIEIQNTLYVETLLPAVTARCAAYGIDLATVEPMGLMPRLVTAHRQLTPDSFDRMGTQFGVRYGIFERRQWNRAAWHNRPILFENPEFVVVATAAPAGRPSPRPSPRDAGRGSPATNGLAFGDPTGCRVTSREPSPHAGRGQGEGQSI
jgi:hypothetical protein